jgi:hypothetical protein
MKRCEYGSWPYPEGLYQAGKGCQGFTFFSPFMSGDKKSFMKLSPEFVAWPPSACPSAVHWHAPVPGFDVA